ncbi:hypothetical protein [Carboxydothermus hydrogenoformans]|uniref:Conserved domain protein n=1 Tax=Carboxydothermus hydrogenoformans (strain ATCC BAA-161 / DSM 6008 / Z-2901) TaxID=246194 RepID=Q3ABP6_CARHZ|nr:hypothetical protein [Carboxydothermus hydrogenoformans]ABB13936.1 conserved domain protein [Carboxydothermus hydrogenoformans Z-2901]
MKNILKLLVLLILSTYLSGCTILEGTPFESLGNKLPDIQILDKIASKLSGKAQLEEAIKNYPEDSKEVVKKALENFKKGKKKVAQIYFSGDESFKKFEDIMKNKKINFEVTAVSESKNTSWVQVNLEGENFLFELWRDSEESKWAIIYVAKGDLKDLE